MSDITEQTLLPLLSALIAHLVDDQFSDAPTDENDAAIYHLREALRAIELRNQRRHRPRTT